MNVVIGSTVYFDFATTSFATGAAANASAVGAMVYEDNGSATLSGVSVAQISTNTGEYRVTVVATAGNGFEVGKTYNVWATATVGGVAGKACIATFIGVVDAPTSLGMASANLDTQLSTIQSTVSNIATTGAAAYQSASSFTKTTGGTETNTYTSTDTSNSVYHQIPDSAGTLDVYYEYVLRPDEVAVGVVFKGRINGTNDSAVVQAYDWVGAAWVTLFSLAGTGGTTDTSQSPPLVTKYTGTGANAGKVRVRIYGTGLTSAVCSVDQCLVAKASTSRSVGYSQGAIWIDSTNGTAGTTAFFNGTADRPVTTWADALALAAALSIYRFNVAPGTQITLTGNSSRYSLEGRGYKLDLGGQQCDYLTVNGCEYLIGTATMPNWEAFFWNCQMGACTLGEFDAHNCHVTDTITLGASSTHYMLNGCVFVPVGTSGIDYASTSNSVVVIGNARGALTIAGMSAGDTLYIDGNCDLTLAASCTGGTVYLAGGHSPDQ